MGREVGISVAAVLIVAAAILTVYYLNVGPTGFAVFEQNTQTTFNEGTYESVEYDVNDSAIILSANQTNGTYTSKVFDSNNTNTTWNNLTWQGNGSLVFDVRACSVSDCNNTNFSSVNLNSLNLTGQYFQYRATFDVANETLQSVTVDYSVLQTPVVTSVSITQPSGTINSRTNVPIQFTASGTGLQCWYNVKSLDGSEIIANTTPSGCANSTFSLAGDGDYAINLFANGSSGFASQSSSFLVSTSPENEPEEEAEETIPPEIPPEIPAEETPSVTQASLGEIPGQDVIQGDSRALSLSVQNTGTVSLSSCTLTGDDSGFITVTDSAKSIGLGESASFAFLVAVPEETPIAQYTLGLSLNCAEITGSRQVTVNVLQKKIDFNITNVQRTRGDRVRVDYIITELAGEDQDISIYFSIKDASGSEIANASQNRSIGANSTDDFSNNIRINETINGTMTLSASFNSQIYSSSVLEPITLGAPTGAAIFEGIGGGSVIILVVVVVVLGAVFFVARKLRKSGKIFGGKSGKDD